MERLSNTTPSGMSGDGLRTWGLVFLAAGVFSCGVLQNRLLGIGALNTQQLLAVMEGNMLAATLALVLQAMETCAVPIFALLLVEGFQHTASFRGYFLRVLGLAVLTELPYNLAMGGKLLDLSSRNPVFGVVLGLVVLYCYTRYAEKSGQNRLIRGLVTLAALVWPLMLQIQHGVCMVALVCLMWRFRKKPVYRNFIGAAAAMLCSLLSPYYLAAPMGFLALHAYNGEKGEAGPMVRYLAYPALLLIIGVGASFL